MFLSERKEFLIDTKTGHGHQTHKIDPDVIYDVAGSGLPYWEGKSFVKDPDKSLDVGKWEANIRWSIDIF